MPSGYGIYGVQLNDVGLFSPWLLAQTGEQLFTMTVGGVVYEKRATGDAAFLDAPKWGVTPNPASVTFPTADIGYLPVTAVEVAVRNSGNQSTGSLSIFLEGADSAKFELSKTSISNLNAGAEEKFTVRPKDALPGRAAAYTTNVSIKDSTNRISSNVAVSFLVNPAKKIDIVDIGGVTAPVAGATPVRTINETAQYTGTVTWNGAPTTFGYGAAYTATITLTPKTGHTLTGVVANSFKVAGATATNPAGSGVITAVFPKTVDATYTASVTPTTKTFTAATFGYAAQTAQEFTIENTGNQTLTGLTASLDGTGFEISTALSPTSLAPGATAKISVRPTTGLTAAKHDATLKLTGANAFAQNVALSFTVTAATITGTLPSYSHTILANDVKNTDAATLKTIANAGKTLPATIEATYDAGKATLNVTWSETAVVFNPKGAIYTWSGAVATGNEFAPVTPLTATLTVTPVKLTAVTADLLAAKTLLKSAVSAAETTVALGFPAQVTLTFDNNVAQSTVNATWDTTLEELKTLANSVNQGDTKEKTVTLTAVNFPVWATVADDLTLPKSALSIIAKHIILADAITVEATPSIPYGTTYKPTATVSEGHGTCTFTFTHDKSATLPTDVGEYTLTVKAESDTHVGTKTFSLTITQATPTIPTPPTVEGTLYVGDPLSGLALIGGAASAAGTFAFQTPTTTYPAAGEQDVVVVFTPTDGANYTTAQTTISIPVVRRQVKTVAAQTAITDKPYGTAEVAVGLPATVTVTTADGKVFENVSVTWSGYQSETLAQQTLSGTLDLTAIAAAVEQPASAISATISVTLIPATPGNVTFADKSVTYSGNAVPHEISNTITGVTTIAHSYAGTNGTSYGPSAAAPKNAGVYAITATFTMAPGFAQIAAKTATLTIAPWSLAAFATEEIPNQTYSGSPITPAITFTENPLVQGNDYTVAYKENVAAGTGIATITGQGNYCAEKQVTFIIEKSDAVMEIVPETITPTFGDTLTVRVTGIHAAPQNRLRIATAPNRVYLYLRGSDTPLAEADVSNDGATLSYTTGSGGLQIGANTLYVAYGGSANLKELVGADFTVTLSAKSLADDMIAAIGNQAYTGAAITPNVTLTDTVGTLGSNHYTVAYENNTNAGIATVTVTGAAAYTGTATTHFTIDPQASKAATIDSTVRYNDTAEQSVDIAVAVASDKLAGDTLHFAVGAISGEKALLPTAPTVDEAGILTYEIAALTETDTGKAVTVPVTITGLNNYTSIVVSVTITVTDATVVTIDPQSIHIENRAYDDTPLALTGAATGKSSEGNYTGTFSYHYVGRDGTAYVESETAPTNAGKYTLKVAITSGGYIGAATSDFAITKAAQDAPTGLTMQRPTTSANDDGKIQGLVSTLRYEYKSGNASYQLIENSDEITGLTLGVYLVRLAGDENHEPSADVEVAVLKHKPRVKILSLTADGISAEVPTTKLTITLEDPTKWQLLPGDITVTGGANMVALSDGENGVYTLTVDGITTNDAKVHVAFNNEDCYFEPIFLETQVYRIVSEPLPEAKFEEVFGVTRAALVQWHKENIVLTGQNGWTAGITVPTIAKSVTLAADGKNSALIYLRKDGTVYETTVLYWLDKQAPLVGNWSGVPTNWVKQAEITLQPSDALSGLSAVTVSLAGTNIPVQAQPNGSYTFTAKANGRYDITVTDLAGNVANQTVEILKVDAIAPTITVTPKTDQAKWYGKTTINVAAADNAGGSGDVAVALTKNGEAVALVGGMFVVATTGTYHITATDAAGNAVTTMLTINVDLAIDTFVSNTKDLNEQTTPEVLLKIKGWYEGQSAIIQLRMSKNDEAKAALVRLNGLLEKHAQAAADSVTELIREADVIEEIEVAQKAFNALTPAGKNKVSAEAKSDLTQKTADAVVAKQMVEIFNAASSAGSYEQQSAALARNSQLTKAQKHLLYAKSDMPPIVASIEDDVSAMNTVLTALSAVKKPYTSATKAAIVAAQTTYSTLDAAQKAAFPRDQKVALDAMGAQLAAAAAVDVAIASLETEAKILAVRGAYSALSADEKLLVEGYATLDNAYQDMMAQKQGDAKAAAEFATHVAAVKSAPTVTSIADLERTYTSLTPAVKALLDASGSKRDYDTLRSNKNAAVPIIAALNVINLTTVTSNSLDQIKAALPSHGQLTADQKALADAATGGKAAVLTAAVTDAAAASQIIARVPSNVDDATGKTEIELAKLTYEKLSDTARRLVSAADKKKLDDAYAALLDHMEYVATAKSAQGTVEVSGLTESVALPVESANAAKTVVSVVVKDTKPNIMPTPSTTEKTQTMSVDVKLVAKIYDSTETGSAPTAEQQVQPKLNESVLIKLQIPQHYQIETLEIWHVKENGDANRIYDFNLVADTGIAYAVFEVSSFSHFVLFAEQSTTSGGGGGGGASGGNVQEENLVLSVGAHGTATLTPIAPKPGAKVTVTTKPDQGYVVDTVTATDATGKTVTVTTGANGVYTFVQPDGQVTVSVTFKKVTTDLPFTDVQASDWYYDGVRYVYGHELFLGTSGSSFSPLNLMTRSMFFTVLARMAGQDVSGGETWYSKAMAWAVSSGISDGSNPDASITREQLVAILYRYAKAKKPAANLSGFSDAAQVNTWAVDAMAWAVESGIISGKGHNTLDPQGQATRAEVATILQRFLSL